MSQDTEPLPNKASQIAEPILLVINTGSIKKKFIFPRLRKLPVKVVVVNKEKNWAEPFVDDWILADTNDHEEVLEKVVAYSRKYPISGVITFWEDDVLLTSKIVDYFDLPGIPYSVSSHVRNKFAFREFCHQHGLPAPKHVLLTDNGQLSEALKLKFPVVIKPTYGSSSAYVVKVEEPSDLATIYDYLNSNLSTQVESALKDGRKILVEEYIEGDEVDIDILLQNGKIKFWSITDNFQTKEPFFVETGMSIPSSLPEHQQEELLEMAELVLERLGVQHGCIHFEAKATKNGAVPVEVNLRMGGDEVYSFVKEAWRVDLIEKAVQIALGQHVAKIKKKEEPYEYLASCSFVPEKSGVISSLEIPEKFEPEYRVDEFHFDKKVGDSVLTPPADFEYLGWMSVRGDNPNDARDNLAAAMKKVTYEIVPFSGESAVGKTLRPSRFSAAALNPAVLRGKARFEKLRHIDIKKQRQLTIGIACNTFSEADGAVEAELASVGRNIEKALNERGYKTVFIDFNNLAGAIKILQAKQIDLVFNVGERLNNSSLLEPHIAALFDSFQIPYTGSTPLTLGMCIDKIRVKKLLTYHDIPTAKWDFAYNMDEAIRDDLTFPLIVKPGNTDNSIGINNDSVVTNKRQLKKQMEYVLTELKRPALVEEYLDGDEYDVSIIGSLEDDLRVLPLSRTVYDKMPKGLWNIYPFEAKFTDIGSYKEFVSVERPPKNVNQKLLQLISEIALDTYRVLDCHDYGRVEIKLDKFNNPHVLELNPNPSINIPDCLPSVAKLTGMDYGDFLEEIIRLAIVRYRNKTPYYHLQTNVG